MQSLRKKTSPFKYKHEGPRFEGEGQTFKGKLIGILQVAQARGDEMCQEALAELKMAVRVAGEHKQRVNINISLNGLQLIDEKTGDSMHCHPVHRISFIAQDMTDSRAFGYVVAGTTNLHQFYGIKTDKAASHIVIAMRDLFQVVFALKKKEIEFAKQHLEKNCLYSSPLFSDSSSNKSGTPELPTKKEAIQNKDNTTTNSTVPKAVTLVDLQLELNQIEEGLHEMEKITPSDPFGDSFTSYPNPILPPPPSSGKERTSRNSDSSSVFSPKTPHTADSLATSGAESYTFNSLPKTDFNFSKEFNSSHEEPSSGEWFTPSNSLFEETSVIPETLTKSAKDEKLEQTKKEILSQFDVFTELDPLELKNPPKKVLNDLVSQSQNQIPNEKDVGGTKTILSATTPKSITGFDTDPFGEDPFVSLDPFAETEFKQDPFEKDFLDYKKINNESINSLLPTFNNITSIGNSSKNVNPLGSIEKFVAKFDEIDIKDTECAPEPPPRPESSIFQIKPPPLPPKKLSSDLLVKLPPKSSHIEESLYDYMNKFNSGSTTLDLSKNLEQSPALPIPLRKSKFESDFTTVPERPAKRFIENSFEDDYLTPIHLSKPEQNLSNTQLSTTLNESPSSTTTGTDSTVVLNQETLKSIRELATTINSHVDNMDNISRIEWREYAASVLDSISKFAESIDHETKTNKAIEKIYAKLQPDIDLTDNQNLKSASIDRYAVLRELINEEIKQTKIDTEPEELQQEKIEKIITQKNIIPRKISLNEMQGDRYAALREIVEEDLLYTKIIEENEEYNTDEIEVSKTNMTTKEINVNETKTVINEIPDIDYNKVVEKSNDIPKPPKSPVKITPRSPIPSAISIIQNNVKLNSGSLSDIVSGSSPEIDNLIIDSEVVNKNNDTTAESWAIFDQTNIQLESVKEKHSVPNEEIVSPWSSDSKEGNGSHSDYKRGDSESGCDQFIRKNEKRDQEDWWDTSAEPENLYSSSTRRSTDSFEEEYYECHERPRRRRQGGWSHSGSQGGGGHSSSSRDVSPWEEEPKRRDIRDGRGGWSRSSKQFDRYRERRPTDSWDEDEDYGYVDSRRSHWKSRDLDRHVGASRDNEETRERWNDSTDRRRRRRRDTDRDHWCCSDWNEDDHDKASSRYGHSRRSNSSTSPGKWRERKHDDRYYSRDESPWEDEYPVEKEDIHSGHYISRRNWKRPNSASEMERKGGDFRSRHYLGGSDGERERRYKGARRSRSRDSHYSEPPYRYKSDTSSLTRNSFKSKSYSQYSKPQFDADFPPNCGIIHSDHSDLNMKKTFTLQNRNKKDSPIEENINTFPRRASKLKPNSDNIHSDIRIVKNEFDNFGIESESPITVKNVKLKQQQSLIEIQKKSPRELKHLINQNRSKSLFEDDFSVEKIENLPDDKSISVIKEEVDSYEETDSYKIDNATNSNRLSKRLSCLLRTDLKKSESINIFARESDPFDDDFFCVNSGDGAPIFDDGIDEKNLKNGDKKWTDNFDS